MDLQIREDTWSYIDEFFRTIPEALRKVPTFQEALEEAMEESEQRGEQRGKQIEAQCTLTLVLRHKFGNLPDHVAQVIETNHDAEQLEQWLKEALDATSLAEINFPPEAD